MITKPSPIYIELPLDRRERKNSVILARASNNNNDTITPKLPRKGFIMSVKPKIRNSRIMIEIKSPE